MLVPAARRRTSPKRSSTSTARASRPPSMWVPATIISCSGLRQALALLLGRSDLPAGERHGLEDALVAEGRLLVGQLGAGRAVRCFLRRIARFFVHENSS